MECWTPPHQKFVYPSTFIYHPATTTTYHTPPLWYPVVRFTRHLRELVPDVCMVMVVSSVGWMGRLITLECRMNSPNIVIISPLCFRSDVMLIWYTLWFMLKFILTLIPLSPPK
jgi:hypothetical protein